MIRKSLSQLLAKRFPSSSSSKRSATHIEIQASQLRSPASSTRSSLVNIQRRRHPDEEPEEPSAKSSKKRKHRSLNVVDGVPAHKALRVSKVSTKTQQQYLQAVQMFEDWCRKQHRSVSSHRRVDEAMAIYLQTLCCDGEPFNYGSYCVYGWILLRSQEHCDPKFQLPFSRQALKGWKAKFPGSSRTGVDLVLWDLVALECIQQGWWLSACAILIQGDAYLRPSEVFAITKKHLVPPRAARTKAIWGVIIGLLELGRPGKSGEYDDVVLFDTACRADVNQVVAHLARRPLSDDQCIFSPLTQSEYGQNIQAALRNLELQKLGLSPHSLRHSGASTDSFHKIRDAKTIQSRGRWKAAESVKRYKKPGRMLLTQKNVSKAIWARASKARPSVISAVLRKR